MNFSEKRSETSPSHARDISGGVRNESITEDGHINQQPPTAHTLPKMLQSPLADVSHKAMTQPAACGISCHLQRSTCLPSAVRSTVRHVF